MTNHTPLLTKIITISSQPSEANLQQIENLEDLYFAHKWPKSFATFTAFVFHPF